MDEFSKEFEPEIPAKGRDSRPQGFLARLGSRFRKQPLNNIEPKEVFEHTRLEFEIKNKLRSWAAEVKPQVAARLEHFGIAGQEAEKVMGKVVDNLFSEVRELNDQENLDRIKRIALEWIENAEFKQQESKQTFLSQVSRLSIREALDLVNRKLSGQINKEEEYLLEILRNAHRGKSIGGSHDELSDEVEITLLSPEPVSGYTRTLHHEVTHLGLSRVVPGSGLAIRETALNIEKAYDTENPAVRNFITVLIAINESIAFRVGVYYGNNEEPPYKKYADKIPPRIFREVYKLVTQVSEGRDVVDFDRVGAKLYAAISARYRSDITQYDLEEAVSEFVKGCNAEVIPKTRET